MRKRILNVGCGNEIYGTDFVDLYPSRKEVKKCDLNWSKLPYEDNFFDEVYSKNLLEHISNVGFVVKQMVRVLKPGGKLTIITDNASFFDYARGRDHLGKYEKTPKPNDRHYLLFTTWHLKNIFRNYKLKIEKIEYLDCIQGWFNLLKPISILLKFTPFWRMAYTQIKIIGIKNRK